MGGSPMNRRHASLNRTLKPTCVCPTRSSKRRPYALETMSRSSTGGSPMNRRHASLDRTLKPICVCLTRSSRRRSARDPKTRALPTVGEVSLLSRNLFLALCMTNCPSHQNRDDDEEQKSEEIVGSHGHIQRLVESAINAGSRESPEGSRSRQEKSARRPPGAQKVEIKTDTQSQTRSKFHHARDRRLNQCGNQPALPCQPNTSLLRRIRSNEVRPSQSG